MEHSYKTLRKAAAGYMKSNEDHFKSFLSLESATFESYCRRIERTNAWGGQHELLALSHVLKRNIQVMRHDMSIQMFPDPETQAPYEGDPIRLSYHIHEYSGGEHYNSIVSLEEKNRRNRAPRGNRCEEEGCSSALAASGAARSGSGEEQEPAVAGAKREPSKLTEDQRMKKMGKKGKLLKKNVIQPKKPLVPWERGVGGEDRRVIVWDTRDGRLILGNSCPIAKNIDRYLQERPHMKIWTGGVDPSEPRAPVRAEHTIANEKQEQVDAATHGAADGGTSAPQEGSAGAGSELDDNASNCSGPITVDEESQAGAAPGRTHQSADINHGVDAQFAEELTHEREPATAHGLELQVALPAAAHQQVKSAEVSASGRAMEGHGLDGMEAGRGIAASTAVEAVLDGQHLEKDCRGEKWEEGETWQTATENAVNSDDGSAKSLSGKSAGSKLLQDGEESVAVYA